MDEIIGHAPGLEKCPTDGPGARGQPGPWPELGDDRPVIASGGGRLLLAPQARFPNCATAAALLRPPPDSLAFLSGYTHSLHHPICDTKYGQPGVMADLLTPYVDINKQLLRCDDESAKDLKLMQQFFRRTGDRRLPAPAACRLPRLPPRPCKWSCSSPIVIACCTRLRRQP